MNKAVPWSIKGIEFDAREAAKEAARREGMTLGEWMNRAIADKAGEAGAGAGDEDYDPDERLEAIAAQLARLSGGPTPSPQRRRGESGGAPADRRRRESADGEENIEESDFDEDWPAERPPSRRPVRMRARPRPATRESAESEPGFERAMAAFQRVAARAQKRAVRAISEAAERFETAEGEREEALAQVDARLADIEDKLHRSGRETATPLRQALGRLEKRIESMSRPTEDSFDDPVLRRLDSRLGSLVARLEKAEETPQGPARDEQLARLERRFDVLAARLERLAPNDASSPRPNAAAAPPVDRADSPRRRGLDDAISQISARQRQLDSGAAAPLRASPPPLAALLDERFEALAKRFDRAAEKSSAPAQGDARIDCLQQGIESLSGRLEDMRREITAANMVARGADASRTTVETALRDLNRRVEAALSAPSGAGIIESLRVELAALGRALADVAPRGAVAGVESALRDLSDRVDSAREAAMRAAEARSDPTPSAEIEALARQVGAMSHALEDVAPRSQMQSLEDAVLALGDRIERSRMEGLREAVLAPIESLAHELRDAMKEAGASANFDGVARQLSDVEAKIEQMRQAGGGDRADFQQVRDQSEALRDMIAAAVEQTAPMERLERQVADLAERLEQAAREAGAQGAAGWREVESRLDDLALRVDRAASQSAEMQPRDDSHFEALSRRLDYMHEALAARIDEAKRGAPGEGPEQALEPLLRSLAEKLDTATTPQADSRAFEALERQIARVSERLERSDPQVAARLESAIADLAARIEASREYEREAAREALREALALAPAPGRDEETAREIADLRERQESSGRRAQETLSAVHETLEKVVDRLALLEDEIVESRAAPADRAPSSAMPAADFNAHDFLMEPGAGRPLGAGATHPSRPDAEAEEAEAPPAASRASDDNPAGRSGRASPQASYIDAARRALAARKAATAADKEQAERKPRAAGPAAPADRRSAFTRPRAAGDKAHNRRMPALILAGVSVLVLGAVEARRLLDGPMSSAQSVISQPLIQRPSPAAAPKSATSQKKAAKPAEAAKAAPASASTKVAPSKSHAPNSAPIVPGAMTPSKPAKGADKGASLPDPFPVGSIGAPPNTLAEAEASARSVSVERLAERGDAAAQYAWGARLAEGHGVDRDPTAALAWFRKAAAHGLAQAQYRLGVIYEKGIGAPRDIKKAATYYRQAAAAGNVRAMHNLAVIAAEGYDGKPDYAKAAHWFRRAADFGVRDSQYNLAILYARGVGVPHSMKESYVWFAIAAKHGDDDAANKRDEVAARLDAKTLAAAKKQVARFHPRTPLAAANVAPPIKAAQTQATAART